MGIVLEGGCLIRAMQRSELHEFPQSWTFENGCKFYLVEFLNYTIYYTYQLERFILLIFIGVLKPETVTPSRCE